MIAVVGPGDGPATDVSAPDASVLAAAERVGELVAAAGHQVVTGGLGGVMAAASRGARAAGATVVALLPGDDAAAANTHADVVIATGLGEGRNVLVVRSSAAVIAVGGSWGTLSEVALAKRMGRPVVWLHGWPVDGVDTAASPEDAVARTLEQLP